VAWYGVRAHAVLLHPRVRGVKCVLRGADGQIVWVRHTYGDRSAWELPGGAVRRSESFVEAARRETREELGVDVERWDDVGTIEGRWTGARQELSCCAADWPAGATLDPDPVEIAVARWAPAGEPPGHVGRVTEGILALVERAMRP
jgi:8-oxo-dGTP pyrophosphatase MutT (NUDIX family)